MAQIKPPQQVKLIVGMLSQLEELFTAAELEMFVRWGPIDIYSQVMEFDFTRYYKKQMGDSLLRKFVSFAELIDPADLATAKHQSNALESALAQTNIGRELGVERPINLDPGYIEPSKLVLASTKNYSHRIYIGESIYAECTLQFHQGKWESWPFTYPDYGSGKYDEFLSAVREKLLEQQSSQKPNT
ncbi:MAG: DUF4416 family protein [Sedimentisphaerales bacterium]|nr:DUF4416 family protein [Sedimentisphaerales bacterium]